MRAMGGVWIVCLALATRWAAAGEDTSETTCQLCGMDASKSETEFVVHRKAGADMHACCINCARRIVKKLGEAVASVTARDDTTGKQVPAAEAFYVMGSSRVPKGSMMPFVFAFGARADADAFQARYGGEVLTFDAVIAKIEAKERSE